MAEDIQVFRDLHNAVKKAIGARLFTISAMNMRERIARKAYTSHSADYPNTGVKEVFDDAWTDHVIKDGKSFIANTTAEFAPYFPDHAQINALGCHSAMNIPVFEGEEVIGTVNILDDEMHFTPEAAQQAEALVRQYEAGLIEPLRAAL